MDWFIAEVGGLEVITREFLLILVIAAVLYPGTARGGRSYVPTPLRPARLGLGGREALRPLGGGCCRGVLLCLIEIGTVPLLAIGVIWMFATGHTGAGVFLLVWTIFIAVIDQAVRPYLMKLGIELPLPLVVVGVIGGLSAFGLVGIFVGPVTLAVAATLLDIWLRDAPQPAADSETLET